MPEPVKRNEPKAHERAMREFVYLFFGPTIWLLHFTAIYAVLAVVWFYLLRRYVVEGPQEHDSDLTPAATPSDSEVAPLSFAY